MCMPGPIRNPRSVSHSRAGACPVPNHLPAESSAGISAFRTPDKALRITPMARAPGQRFGAPDPAHSDRFGRVSRSARPVTSTVPGFSNSAFMAIADGYRSAGSRAIACRTISSTCGEIWWRIFAGSRGSPTTRACITRNGFGSSKGTFRSPSRKASRPGYRCRCVRRRAGL